MILCVCKYGHSRSVAATRLLHRHGLEAIACGWHTNPKLLLQLCDMADRIIVLEASYRAYIPLHHWEKLSICDVGADKWRNPYDDELIELLKPMIDKVVQSMQA